ncbi:MAG: transcriptional regulator [Planctomycetota bacterium]|nr:MAG: transcriptional regulator [Planctomycetota bacterium]
MHVKTRRSPCPVACTLDLIGDKWTLLLIRDMSFGRSHFKEFSQSPEGIATNILADRLARLVESGLAEKFPSPEVPGREAYRLTEKGESLRPIMMALAKWGLDHIEGTAALMKPRG